MKIDRGRPGAANSEKLAEVLNTLYGPCIECSECHGLCPSLIEALMLPDAVLKKNRRSEARNDTSTDTGPDAPD